MRNAFALAALVLTPFATGGAQSPANPKLTPAAESAFVRYAESVVVEKLGGWIATAAHDTVPHPWNFLLPKAGSQTEWQELRTHLTAALRARPQNPQDSVYNYFRIEAPRVRGDTMFFRITIGFAQHCAVTGKVKTWWDNSQAYEIMTGLSSGTWMAPTVTTGEEAYSAWCQWRR